ncbi:hypothetical protein PG997_012881 [Apiospora hydei]|uniref:Rhodopsin domain-containing protein n=1 Tax=Apiospora hydei TaxID=1337664 RepID=A0ABR1V4L5_9PEZI
MDDGYLDTTPLRPPPPGHKSNFVNPESRSYQLVIAISVLSFLTIIFTSSRIYTRTRVTHSFGIDDLCDMPGGGILGIHLWDVNLRRYLFYAKASLADSTFFRICNTLIKVSFFLFYRRLFRPVTHVKVMVWVGIALVTTFCVAYIIIDIVACAPWPSEHGWLDPNTMKRCGAIAPKLVTAGAYFSVLTDFYILAIPLQQVPQLRLSKRRKVGLSFIFLTGLLACGAGLTNLILRQTPGLQDTSDFSWTLVPIYATCVGPVRGPPYEHRQVLSSWIRARRSPHHSSAGGESSANLTPDRPHGPHHGGATPPTAPADPPQLPRVPNSTLSGMLEEHAREPVHKRERGGVGKNFGGNGHPRIEHEV